MGCLINAFDFKEFFTKDFEYGDEEGQFSDNDISRAIQEADMNFNKDLLPDADKQRLLLLYLAAFIWLSIETIKIRKVLQIMVVF